MRPGGSQPPTGSGPSKPAPCAGPYACGLLYLVSQPTNATLTSTKLLADQAELAASLDDLVAWAETLDLAYAWMASADGELAAWSSLPDAKISRAIIGVQFGSTEPHVLEYFAAVAPKRVRVIEDLRGTFHPKVIVGRRGRQRRAIIGSSNFTPGGFGNNTELNVLLEGCETDEVFSSLDLAISNYWRRARSINASVIQSVTRAWQRRSRQNPKPVLSRRRATLGTDDLHIDWSDYVELLKAQERRHCDLTVSASPKNSSQQNYLGEAHRAHEAFKKHERFQDMDYEEEARFVAGFGPDAGWFGRLRGNGVFMRLVKNAPEKIGPIIDGIPLNEDGNTVRVDDGLVEAAFEYAQTLDRVRIGTVTRLLCIKRPDLFFPVNDGNKRRMRSMLGFVPKDGPGYLDALARVRSYPWYSAPEPSDPHERELWRCRTGLLDAVWYEPS